VVREELLVRHVVFLGDGSHSWMTTLEEIPYRGRRGRLLGSGLVVPWLGGSRIVYVVDRVGDFDGLLQVNAPARLVDLRSSRRVAYYQRRRAEIAVVFYA
jgi:hypothetical protein